jgi:hypothetical protein
MLNSLFKSIILASGLLCGAHGAILSLPETHFLPYPYKGGFAHLVPTEGGTTISNAEICFFMSSYQAVYDDDGNLMDWENGGAIIMGGGNSGISPGSSAFRVEVLINRSTGWPMQLGGGNLIKKFVSGGYWQSNWSYEWSGSDGGFNSTWGNFLAFRILVPDGEHYGYEILDWNHTEPTIEYPISSYKLAGYGKIETDANTPIMVIPEPSYSALLIAVACFGLSCRSRQ